MPAVNPVSPFKGRKALAFRTKAATPAPGKPDTHTIPATSHSPNHPAKPESTEQTGKVPEAGTAPTSDMLSGENKSFRVGRSPFRGPPPLRFGRKALDEPGKDAQGGYLPLVDRQGLERAGVDASSPFHQGVLFQTG
jgi:hypothetical protein